MKTKNGLVKRTIGIVAIPLATFIILTILCATEGTLILNGNKQYVDFLKSVASVMFTTFALSINLNSGRFDFSIGSIALVSSIISSTICMKYGLTSPVMLAISIGVGACLGLFSGLVYVIVKLPPIIVSLGMALFYEGLAFNITGGYGVSIGATYKETLLSFPSVLNFLLLIIGGLVVIIFLFDRTKFGFNYKALMSGQKVAVNTGIKEVPNALGCYAIAGMCMGVVGFIAATSTGNIRMALNFGSIGTMFTAFLPMFIGGFIGRFCNEKIGYLLGAVTTGLISQGYARLKVDNDVQQITTALILVCFLIYLNNENKIQSLFRCIGGNPKKADEASVENIEETPQVNG